MAWRHLTDAQWDQIRPHLPAAPRRPRGGRPTASTRRCFEGNPVGPLDWRPMERIAPPIEGSQRGAPGVVASVPGPAQ